MLGFHLYKSNRLEALAEALAEVTRAPLRAVLQPEMVIVQSLGMRRWLSLELARLHGVAMNCAFPFPVDFIQGVFHAAFPDLERTRAFDRALLPWRILKHLPEWLGKPGFEDLARYLHGEARSLKEFQLAQKIAAVFDRYLAYRPEWILQWQSGRDKNWQAQLWRVLARGHENAHTPALAQRLQRELSGGIPQLSGLPERISIFGISSLPPLYLHLIGEVSKLLEVHFFHLEPTDLYWGDIQSAREQERILRKHPRRDISPEALHFENGNALLASLGKAGRDFSRLLVDLNPTSETSLFKSDSKPPHLLGRLQADIFRLEEGVEEESFALSADDHSIQVHCCHGPMRELEVLHDRLLALFEADPALTPRDILVTMPDVETYAPFIDAVFGAPESPEVSIPFTIADRSARAESTAADAFLRLLDLTGGRFGVATVFTVLETQIIQRRFDLDESDLAMLREWVRETGIRWGIDAAHRAGLGQPAFPENTWRGGLRRLLLGYAMPGDGRTLFDGILPVREVEGALASTLGRFVDFAESLFDSVRGLEARRSLAEWEEAFRNLLDTFFSDDDEFADELHRIRAVVEGLGAAQRETEFTAPVDFDAVRAHLLSALADTDSGIGFLAGSVTFCALKPMRSIPFKVICMLGMNDTAFPRYDSPPAFDLAAAEPRAGDRTLRDDDRHLFLETLLSARDTLYISYSGLSNRDNRESPPAAPVGELLDHLETRFGSGKEGALRDALVLKHRLQPFSGAYFQPGERLFSYSQENCRACERVQAPREAAAIFAGTALPESEGEGRGGGRLEAAATQPEGREIDWERLAEFYRNPSRYFARERLGLRLPGEILPLDECEPQSLGRLERYQFEEEFTAEAVATGRIRAGSHEFARATGQLPPGYLGDSEFKTLARHAIEIAERVRSHVPGAPLAPLPVDVKAGDWQLSGVLRDLYPSALLRRRAANLNAKDRLGAWIAHLVLQCAAPAGGPRETLLFGSDKAVRFQPIASPLTVLGDLIELYAGGLRSPLPFFPECSYEFAVSTLQPGARTTKALEAARSKWLPNEFAGGKSESEDEWIKLCFRGRTELFDAQWQETALRIFEPLLSHQTPLKP